jgi:predicted nicotinamide N-methyase
VRVGEVELSILRPETPEDLLDEDAFAQDEFLPYWAELWPAAIALASALPARLSGVRVVELGCGLGIPSLVAARRGAAVTATDWADEAIELLRQNGGPERDRPARRASRLARGVGRPVRSRPRGGRPLRAAQR